MQVNVIDDKELNQNMQTTIHSNKKVQTIALSASGIVLAIVDVTAMVSLYNSNGTLLLEYQLDLDVSDTVVSMNLMSLHYSESSSEIFKLVIVSKHGILLELGDFRLTELELLAAEKLQNGRKEILDTLCCNRISADCLKDGAPSCILNKVAVSFKSGIVDAMDFDTNYSTLVILCDGKLSWWHWRDSLTELFEANITRIVSFAILKGCGENKHEEISRLAVARSYQDGKFMPSFELLEILHKESANVQASVVSKFKSIINLKTPATYLNVALFASKNSSTQAFAACRTDRGISMFMLTEESDISSNITSESFVSEDKDMIYDQDAVSIAESLASTPISFLLQEQNMKQIQANLNICMSCIGESDEDSRVILNNLLAVAAKIREHLSSSPCFSLDLTLLSRWCDEISELSYKWTTFQLLYDISTESYGMTRFEKWQQFQVKAVSDIMLTYIEMGCMRAVRILWDRHVDEVIIRNIGILLEHLPPSLPLSAFAPWIQSRVLPSLLTYLEQSQIVKAVDSTEARREDLLANVVMWILKRAEAAAAQSDIDTAIGICNLLRSLDAEIAMDVAVVYPNGSKSQTLSKLNDPAQSAEASWELNLSERLEQLYDKLRHVQYLAVEHHFVISFPVFEGETPATIAMSMMDRGLDADSLKTEVNEHVQKYLRAYNVDVDLVLYEYVTELAESISTCDSTGESRVLVLLDEIQNENLRVDATLAILRSVIPPYSDTLKNYVTHCTRWETERVHEIKERVRLMKIQDMLTKYNIKRYDSTDTKSASRYMSHILTHVSMPTAFKDAMLLIDAHSGLRCDRAAVLFTENLFYIAEETSSDRISNEVSIRVASAMEAFAEVKKRIVLSMLHASLLEEVVEFGVMLLEVEAEEMEQAYDKSTNKPQSFVLCMLRSLVEAFVSELKSLLRFASTDSIRDYVESSEYLLSDALLTDLNTICYIEAEFGLLLSISALRDPKVCKKKLKNLIKPDVLFRGNDELKSTNDCVVDATGSVRGKGKKRAAVLTQLSNAEKRQRNSQSIEHQPSCFTDLKLRPNRALQQDDEKIRLSFNLNRFASAVGIDAEKCRVLIAQVAVECGFILQAVHWTRGLFIKKLSGRSNSSILSNSSKHTVFSSKMNLAKTLKKFVLSLLSYSSSDGIYGEVIPHNQSHIQVDLAQAQALTYALELLSFALCTCDKEDLDELLLLFKMTSHVNEALQLTQHNDSKTKINEGWWKLYPRWYRGDACALTSYKTMKLMKKFAMTEYDNIRRKGQDKDLIAFKHYVSFLVEQRADLLSLQALMSMPELDEEAAIVANNQMIKLLLSVFQSQEIDNHLALGYDAFHAFRKQISRENVAKDFQRFQHLALIGADAARAWQQIAFLHQCVELEENARWWHYLTLLGIECDHKAFHSKRRNLAYIRRLVPQLLTRSSYDFYTVLEFTRYYQIDDSFTALVYVQVLLVEPSATTNLEYQDKIAGVLSDIHEQHLIKMLLKSIGKISGHDYDRLLFAFRLLLEKTTYCERKEVTRRMEILRILKEFAAFSSRNIQPLNKHVIRDSKRLSHDVSFHELMAKPREVLSRLVSRENFESLIQLAEPLQLQRNELLMLLLKNMIDTHLKCTSTIERDRCTTMIAFGAFEGILQGLSDIESRVTAAEWLAENFPLGDEKLKALNFALKAAESSQEEFESLTNTSFTGREALTRLEAKVLKVKVEMLLRKAKLQTSNGAEVNNVQVQTNQLVALVSEPEKLFRELYKRCALECFDEKNDVLDALASNIGNLLHLPQAKIRLDLVREWLVTDAVHFDKVVTSQEDPFEHVQEEKLHKIDQDFVKRIVCLASKSVKIGNSFGEQVFSFLVEFARDSRPRTGVTFRAKLRALCVIQRLSQLYRAAVVRIVDSKYNVENTDSFLIELVEYRKHCTHMVTFEEHRVPYDMAYLLECDKEVLTRSILQRFSLHEPWVLQCASHLMLEFGIEALDLWEDVLTNMLQLGMIRSLHAILEALSSKVFVRSLKCGRHVWEKVLISPLFFLKDRLQHQSTSGQDTSECDRLSKFKHERNVASPSFAGIPIVNIRCVLERMVKLLQRCPFLDQIDVPAIVKHVRDLATLAEDEANGAEIARQIDLNGCGIKCAMVIPQPLARYESLVEYIHAKAYDSVYNELLENFCFIDCKPGIDNNDEEIGHDYRLIQKCFSEAAKRKDYAFIMNTRLETQFIEYLAANASIDYLVSLLLADERMEAALKAVEFYYKYHPSTAPSIKKSACFESDSNQEVGASSLTRWEILDAYLASSTSEHLTQYQASKQFCEDE
ncbi:putative RZZ complex, subunit KNTC1/ROD protein [Plasmopara halstedii]